MPETPTCRFSITVRQDRAVWGRPHFSASLALASRFSTAFTHSSQVMGAAGVKPARSGEASACMGYARQRILRPSRDQCGPGEARILSSMKSMILSELLSSMKSMIHEAHDYWNSAQGHYGNYLGWGWR